MMRCVHAEHALTRGLFRKESESGRLARAHHVPEQGSRALSRNDVSFELIEFNGFACHAVGPVQAAGRQEDACQHHPCVAPQIELVGAISELYGHIQKDTRHKDVVLLHYDEISERRFGGWTMGQVNLSKLNVSTLLKYSEKPELDPYAVSGKVSLALLEELMATAAIVGRH